MKYNTEDKFVELGWKRALIQRQCKTNMLRNEREDEVVFQRGQTHNLPGANLKLYH